MKTKALGFTLIELLVVIVIIGILATVSTATFGQYFGKARDAARKTNISTIAMMFRVDGSTNWNNNKYVYSEEALQALFDENDYRAPKGDNNICYFIGMGAGESPVGDDNQFVIATWGESTSTDDANNPGLLYDGTAAAMEALESGGTATEANLLCNGNTSVVGAATIWTDIELDMQDDGTGANAAITGDDMAVVGGWVSIVKDGTLQEAGTETIEDGRGVAEAEA